MSETTSKQKWESLRADAERLTQERRHSQAEARWLAALEIAESLGVNNSMLVYTLSSLGEIFFLQNKYALAAPISRRLIAMYQDALGPEHLEVGVMVSNLAMVYHAWRRYEDAEPLYRAALSIKSRVLGTAHPEVLILKQDYANMLKAADAAKSGRLTISGNWQSMSSDCWKVFSPEEQITEEPIT